MSLTHQEPQPGENFCRLIEGMNCAITIDKANESFFIHVESLDERNMAKGVWLILNPTTKMEMKEIKPEPPPFEG